ncbi:MAG: hypothetical protein O2973_13675 [Gemmatimonadetes bacterium]|nr:hypothetical protein [Gemmatimonadota bacterium]MQC48494.1 hypothetical protein [Chloroflexota bacterium]
MPAPPAGPTLADFAGTWDNTSTLTGVADPLKSTMTLTADGVGSTLTLEGRDPIALQVSVVGDSLISQSAEYESILRSGVMVSTRTAGVLADGMLTGNMVATYKTPAGEELVTGTLMGMRAPMKP